MKCSICGELNDSLAQAKTPNAIGVINYQEVLSIEDRIAVHKEIAHSDNQTAITAHISTEPMKPV